MSSLRINNISPMFPCGDMLTRMASSRGCSGHHGIN